jgi:hypothetical protein
MGKAVTRQLNAETAGPGRPQQPPPPGNHGRRQHLPPGVSGRPLVEVFGTRTNFPVVGTIAVFDGTCGQIVYENDQGRGRARISNPEVCSMHVCFISCCYGYGCWHISILHSTFTSFEKIFKGSLKGYSY